MEVGFDRSVVRHTGIDIALLFTDLFTPCLGVTVNELKSRFAECYTQYESDRICMYIPC